MGEKCSGKHIFDERGKRMQESHDMTLGSFFDGIGGSLLAAQHAGVTPIWASEIESFPCFVTRKHFPDVIHFGDITKLTPDTLPPVDIICVGSPCQDLSIAGKRKGLDGERSGLFKTAISIFHQMRERRGRPRFFVWENVPGAFSSNKGMDFRAVLEEIGQTEIPMPQGNRWAPAGLAELPECQIAWRVLDAQYWGVPQRRRRIFLVADFAADGRCAGEILFESEGVQGDTAAGEGAREEAAGGAEDCARTSGAITSWDVQSKRIYDENGGNGKGVLAETAYTLNTIDHHAVAEIYGMKSYSEYACHKVAALRASGGACGGGSENLALSASVVRRLTPTECERLQGLPDGYTEGGSDATRYKALGNGMAQPCIDYVIRRIAECAQLFRRKETHKCSTKE